MGENHSRRRILQIGAVAILGGAAGCADFASNEPASEPGANDSRPESDDEETGSESDVDAGSDDEEPDEGEGSDATDGADESDDEDDEGEPDEYEIEEPTGALADVPIPEDPGSHQFPVAGTGDADVRVEFFGGWKCRHTRRFVEGGFADLLDEYVRTGDVDLEFHGVAYRNGGRLHGEDGPRTARAGLAVWYAQPEAFWSYFEYVYANVERRDGWAEPDRLRRVADEAGVEDHEQFARTVRSGAFEDQLEETMERVEERPITAVPRIAVDGDPYSPTAHRDDLVEAVEAALEEADD